MKSSIFRLLGVAGLAACTLFEVTLFQQVLPTAAKGPDKEPLADRYTAVVQPLVKKYCLKCHGAKAKKGNLDLEWFATLGDFRKDPKALPKMIDQLEGGEMPPSGLPQPTAEERKQLLAWVRGFLDSEARASAGDPGPVVLRRLNNAEYTYTIRDLTGVELSPAREFPADGAAGEGFTNTGNALAMSPALLQKYFNAGKEIAAHALLLPDGFRFSPHTTRRDWTDEILAKIRGIYREFVEPANVGVGDFDVHGDTQLGQAGRLPLEKYLAATLAERDALKGSGKTIEAVARERGLNARYLGTLWSALTESKPSLLLVGLRSRWRSAKPSDAAVLAAEVAAWQKGLWTFGPVGVIGSQGSPARWMAPVNPLVTKQDIRFQIPAAPKGEKPKEVVVSLVATDAGDGNEHDFVVWQQPRLVAKGRPDILLRDIKESGLDPALFGKHPGGAAIDAASLCVRAPAVLTIRLPAQVAAGCDLVTTAVLDKEMGEGSVQVAVFAGTPAAKSGLLPSEVVVNLSQVRQGYSHRRQISFVRPVLVGKNSKAQMRFEAAFDEHRRLFPAALCYFQIVPVDEVVTLTLFYREDDHFVRLMLDQSQKAGLDRLWDELHYVSQSPLMHLHALELLLEVLSGDGQADRTRYNAILPLRMSYNERAGAFKKELIAAEAKQVDALLDFAARAYRRPLTKRESNGLRELYRKLRGQTIGHEDAFRLTLARALASAAFLYRIEERRPVKNQNAGRPLAHPVSDRELAGRLSYFLWSSLPDEELRAAAEAEQLQKPEVIRAQTRRMLKDARVRRLAIEFACQWLHIRDFDQLNEKSEKHFPSFVGLRADMYEESIRFFADLFQNDGSILSILNADHTFLNERLAAHYGIPTVKGPGWRRVDDVRRHARGSILTQATVLAKQSGASRTSPILRGNFVFETLLGERMPRPPKDVPQLPDTVPAGLSERELIEKHSSAPACAKCHTRMDPFGFALERFDAIGRLRDKDAAGRLLDTRTTLFDGTKIEGLDGLRDYLLTKRRDDFVKQFCRKLLGYSLGRAVQLSDEPLLQDMRERLAKNDYRFSVAVEAIVLSDQFRKIRAAGVGGE